MTGEIIKSFLVGLGFSVDDSSLAKFNKAISSAAVKVTALYTSVKVMASGIVYGISQVSESFEFRIIAPAINKTLLLRRELLKAYGAAGINLTKVIQQSVKLNFSITKTRYAFEALYKSVASRFFTLLTKSSDTFRNKLYANMPKIQNALERFVQFVFKAFEATTALGLRLWSILTRVYDFFVMLHKATDGWSTVILGVIAAWKLLNLSFLATPLGMLLSGFLAILALYDDFKTFQEGGKSFFDWSSAIPYIEKYLGYLSAVRDTIVQIILVVSDLIKAIWKLGQLDFSGFMGALKSALSGMIALFDRYMAVLGRAFDFAKTVGGGLLDALGATDGSLSGRVETGADNLKNGLLAALGANPQAAAQSVSPGGGQTAPLGGNASNSLTNMNVKQQTTITVQGSADANSTAKTVAGEQGRVNFDMVRNLKGATR